MKAIQHILSIAAILSMIGIRPVHAISADLNGNGFEENKGQITTTLGEPATFVKFRYTDGNARIFLLENGIAYQFERLHFPEGYAEARIAARQDLDQRALFDEMRQEVRLETFRMDMLLEGATRNARITTKGLCSDHTNYYAHDALRVPRYQEVIYHDVYPGIDWVIRTTENGIKYDFIIDPGADPSMIKLKFTDHEELYVDGGGRLIHGNRMGRFTEQGPVSFQGDKEIATSFDLQGNILRFNVGAHDHTKTLIIDPDRIWGTYYGGNGFDDGWEVATDSLGNVYSLAAPVPRA